MGQIIKFEDKKIQGDFIVENIESKNLYDSMYIHGTNTPTFIIENWYYAGFTLPINILKLQSNEQYTWSYNVIFNENNNVQFGTIVFWDSDNNFVGEFSTNESAIGIQKVIFTVPSNATYIEFRYNRKMILHTDKITIDEIQLEKGIQATPYSPHYDFKNQEIYSTNEICIGTWIDGKPLYRKVIETTKSNLIAKCNEDYSSRQFIVNYKGFMQANNNVYMPINNAFTDNAFKWTLWFFSENRVIAGQFGSNFTDDSYVVVTLEYTKTTD